MAEDQDDGAKKTLAAAVALVAAGCNIKKTGPAGKPNVPAADTKPSAARPADRPIDRIPDDAPPGDLPDPRVFLVADGRKFVRPSLETYYSEAADKPAPGQTTVCSCNTVTGTYCSCNKVCSCNLVCTCQSMCGCVGYSPPSKGGGGGGYCSCNKVCSCVPVH